MAFPSRKRDLRSITVNDQIFRWRLSPKETHSVLVVYGPSTGHQPLSVTLRNWADRWLVFPRAVDNNPHHVTPKFVQSAIIFGLSQGWHPEAHGTATAIEWNGENFIAPHPEDSRNTNSA